MIRKQNVWKCVLLKGGQEQVEVEFKAHWDPEKVDTEEIAKAAAAVATVNSSNSKDDRIPFIPISAQFVPAAA